MGLVLIIVGLLLWLLAGWTIVGVVLIVVGLIVLLALDAPYGGRSYYRRGP